MTTLKFMLPVFLLLLSIDIDKNKETTTIQKVEDLLAKMTLQEKIGQMNQYNGFWDVTGPEPEGGDAAEKYKNLRAGRVGSMLNVHGVEQVRKLQEIAVQETRLGIPLIFGFDVIHGYKTLSPIPLAEAASWDMEAIKKSATIAAREAASAGINWTFAPMVDISRDARWGRVMEGGGEDPYLGSKIAVARVKGFQGDNLASTETIAACAKHFAAYGFIEAGREYNTVSMSQNLLRNVVLPPFKAAVEAGTASLMNAFNDLNGVPATADELLLRDILKGEWGFNGFVVSDWGSVGELVEHGFAKNLEEAAQKAANAGCDMDMESYAFLNYLEGLVVSGQVSESVIDEAAGRILKIKFDLGLFDDPYKYCNLERQKATLYAKEHKEAVREIAKKSIVLLKNEENLLPLAKSGKKIALIGPLVDDKNSPLGSWRLASDDNTAVSVREALESLYKGNEYVYRQGVKLVKEEPIFINEVKINYDDWSGMEAAINAAKQSDIVIMVLGEHGFMSGEARSRVDLDLPGLQEELLKKVHEVNPHVVLVLMSGRPLTINWAQENIPAIMEAWQLGTESGYAIAEVLMGEYNPSGKLPMTFPRHVGQVPIYYNRKNTGRPRNVSGLPDFVFWSHYNDVSNDPLYPFGHGLSYTTFAYSDLQVEATSNGAVVSVVLSNTGSYAGEEVVQLYIRDLVASLTRPIKELKGFEKVMLKPGESKKITFSLGDTELGFYNNTGKFVVEAGEFEVMIGGNSRDLLRGKFELKK